MGQGSDSWTWWGNATSNSAALQDADTAGGDARLLFDLEMVIHRQRSMGTGPLSHIPTQTFTPFATPHKPLSFFSVVRTGPARVKHSLASV